MRAVDSKLPSHPWSTDFTCNRSGAVISTYALCSRVRACSIKYFRTRASAVIGLVAGSIEVRNWRLHHFFEVTLNRFDSRFVDPIRRCFDSCCRVVMSNISINHLCGILYHLQHHAHKAFLSLNSTSFNYFCNQIQHDVKVLYW